MSNRLHSRVALVAVALAAAVLSPLAAVGVASAAAGRATYVIQGVPGASVDVSVDGDLVQSDVMPKQILGPLVLDAGEHTVEFSTPDWTAETTVDVSRRSHDIVVHLAADAGDDPMVTVFDNNLHAVGADEGRLSVAHTAVVPPADVLASGEVLFSNIANGEFVTAEVPADTYSVEVVPTGGGRPFLGPVDVPIKAGALTRVFAIGTPRDQSMNAVVHVLPLPSSGAAPAAMDTGTAGFAPASTSTAPAPAGWVVPTLLGALLLGLGVVVWRSHARA